MIDRAYGKESFQIFGGPGWVTSLADADRFDVVAQVPPGTSDAQFAVMLQNPMVDRVGLKVHHEARNRMGTQRDLGNRAGAVVFKRPSRFDKSAAD